MNRIKLLRNKFGYSQEILSEKIGVSKGMIALYENEYRKPSLEVLIKLSNVFNVSVDYLLCLSNVPEISKISNDDKYYMCPVYDKTCSYDGLCFKNPIGRIPIDEKLINISSSDEFLFFKLSDNSMNYIIQKNSYAFIHLQDFVENNKIALVYVNNEFLLRKLFIKNSKIVLSPISNDESFSIEILSLKDVKIIGLYDGKLEI